ncbi:MAG: hypothetical protein ACYCZM_07245, partial [Acidimicrobiales bacterium]
TTSYYIDNLTPSVLADEGCYDTGSSVTGNRNIVLDFGGQFADSSSTDGYGAKSPFSGVQIPDFSANNASVQTEALDFINGWTYCSSGTLPGFIGIGTNNSTGNNVNNTTGHLWGNLAVSIYSTYENAQSGNGPLYIHGADDIEPGFGSFSNAKEWIGGLVPAARGSSGSDGFQASGSTYFDYGSADGCTSSGCYGGWTDSNVFDVAYGYAGAIAMPEIYYSGEPPDWVAVEGAGYIAFSTIMTQNFKVPSSYTPPDAWSAFSTATSQYDMTSTDIRNS